MTIFLQIPSAIHVFSVPYLDVLSLEMRDPLVELSAHVDRADGLHVLGDDAVFQVHAVIVLAKRTKVTVANLLRLDW